MSKSNKLSAVSLADVCALKLQELHREGKVDGDQPLLKIDYREEAATAPFQFDVIQARLHRTGCKAIGRDSKSALYGVWVVSPEDLKYACEQCRPAPTKQNAMDKDGASDLLFGFISILDQFGSVLGERGREYRNSERGRQIEVTIEDAFSELDQKQREALDTVLSALDNLLTAINGYNRSLQAADNNGDRRKG